jgi:hypothetical protein
MFDISILAITPSGKLTLTLLLFLEKSSLSKLTNFCIFSFTSTLKNYFSKEQASDAIISIAFFTFSNK